MSQTEINFFLPDAMLYHVSRINAEKYETVLTETKLL